MRIEANLTAELDGKALIIKWKNKKIKKKIREITTEHLDRLDELRSDDELEDSELDDKFTQAQAKYWHDVSDQIFVFDDGTPPVEWFAREDFSEGKWEFLRQVFTNPQIQT